MIRPTRLDKRACEARASEVLLEAGIRRHPVKVDRIAKRNGIRIRYEPLDDELSGMIFLKDNQAIIGVNAHHRPNRQRFTIAHELGHFFLHSDILEQGAHVDTMISMLKRDQDAALGTVNIEVEANQFAAELLMPKKFIRAYLAQEGIAQTAVADDDVIENLANAFRVSVAAMAIRLTSIL